MFSGDELYDDDITSGPYTPELDDFEEEEQAEADDYRYEDERGDEYHDDEEQG